MTPMPVPGAAAGRLRSLHRYPVKSLVGEDLDAATVDARGVVGDRLWSVRDPDGKLGSGKSSRRFRKMDGLLALVARYDGEVPVIAFPDGRAVRGDDPGVHAALSAHVGRPVTLAREASVSHFDDGPIHVVTTASLRRLETAHGDRIDVRRFRPNLVLDTGDLDGFAEDEWVGRRLAIGRDLVLAVRDRMPRCVMVTLPQHGLAEDPDLLRTTTDANDMMLGVVADVLSPGTVAVGDEARLLG
jgi:uncharacterized protein YcbX